MKLKFTFNLFTLVFLLFGCAGIKKTTENKKIESEIKSDAIIKVESFKDFDLSRDFKIEELLIQNEILEIRLTYSGGCAQHQFKLYTCQQYQKSLPPKLPLMLIHDTGGDACREIKQETVLFNIEDLKYEGQNTVQFIINQEYTVNYTY